MSVQKGVSWSDPLQRIFGVREIFLEDLIFICKPSVNMHKLHKARGKVAQWSRVQCTVLQFRGH